MTAKLKRHDKLRQALRATGLAAALLLMGAGSAAASWWNADWTNRVKIDADAGAKGANIGEAIGRTQVLVRLIGGPGGNFKFDSAKQDGSDLRFVAADDKTPMHYHIEKWDALVDQVALVWVDVPDLAPGTVSNFFMYWGNDKAADGADAHATYDADQLLVWHFGGDSALPHDSTGYNNNALTPAPRDEAGIIGQGTKITGATQIKLAPSAALNLSAGEAYTWQVWAKLAPLNQTSVIYDQRDTGGVADLQIGLAAGVPYVQATPAAGALVRAQAGAAITGDTWHLITVTGAADKLRIYVDGNKVGEAAGALPAIDGPGILGGAAAVAAVAAPAPVTPAVKGVVAPAPVPAAAPLANFQGELDELQISKVVRPDGAIQVAVHDQGPGSNLVSLGAPEQTSSFSTGYIGILLHSITPDAEFVIGLLMVMMLISWVVMVNRGYVVAATRGSNKRFRVALRETMRGSHGREILPALPAGSAKKIGRASSLLAIYDTGVREVHDRLKGGRCLPDGSIAPQSLAAIRAAMDAQMVREMQRLNNLMVLLTIAIAGGPFIGLLGTVVGVMITFAAIAAAGDVNVNSIAPGIAAALLATVAGLAVAIPSLFGYNYFQVRIKDTVSDMSVFVDEIVTRIAEGNIGSDRTQPGE